MSDALERALRDIVDDNTLGAVAVSGGVDSSTLMAFAHARGFSVEAIHAVSPAVPPAATARVEELARRLEWRLSIIDAGETDDEAYLANPADRCRVCKSHLYDAMRARTPGPLMSGTNLDDLDDFRPGLDAARARGVRHPFVEARMTKSDVRALARMLGLDDVAELPAQPCLSSRIETGIRIEPRLLSLVDDVETAVRGRLGASTVVRCRVKKGGVVIELDSGVLARLETGARRALVDDAQPLLTRAGFDGATLAPYKMGSAFLRVVT